MENEKIITLQLQLTRRKVFFILTAFFLCWHPRFLGSETLTLTTYYPAPYGGYASLLTTGQTLLARDGGKVGVRLGDGVIPTQELEVGGVMQGKSLKFAKPGFDSSAANDPYAIYQQSGVWAPPYPDLMIRYFSGISYDAYRGNGGHRFYTGVGTAAGPDLLEMQITDKVAVTDNLAIGGTITGLVPGVGLCRSVPYGDNDAIGCTGDEQVFSWFGDGQIRVAGMLTTNSEGAGTWVGMGQDWKGTMLCCKIQ